MKNPWVIIGIITVVLFGGAIWYSGVSSDQNNEGVEIAEKIKGNPDAAVTLVEYSDFQCPACASFQPVVAEILSKYGDKLKFEYKHFPLPIHPHALAAAVAAEAAGQQDKFFEFHDLLFTNQKTWAAAGNPSTFFIQYAEELDLDLDTFKRHMNSTVLRDKARADFKDGQELGVSGTPSFYLNGEFLDPNEFKTIEGFVDRIAMAVDPESASTSESTSGAEVKLGL